MELLRKIEDGGYPTEYLVARIQGRSAAFLRDWDALIFSPDPLASLAATGYRNIIAARAEDIPWQRLAREYEWVYLQMNSALRRIFKPFFTHQELRTLFLALRYKRGNDEKRLQEVLLASLLAKTVKTTLRDLPDVPAVLPEVERVLIVMSPRFSGLEDLFLRGGLGAVEQHITDTCLEHTVRSPLHPIMRGFFRRLIDMRNIMSLYKHQRWTMKDRPLFLRGGTIEEPVLTQAAGSRTGEGASDLIARLTGTAPEIITPTSVEHALIEGMTRLLKKEARTASEIGRILQYLWQCFIEARNLSAILAGRDMDRELVSQEILS
ncbi:MAG: V-type ATPase subunit [Nitrospirota bacterium]